MVKQLVEKNKQLEERNERMEKRMRFLETQFKLLCSVQHWNVADAVIVKVFSFLSAATLANAFQVCKKVKEIGSLFLPIVYSPDCSFVCSGEILLRDISNLR